MVAATQFVVFITVAFAWFPGWMTAMKEMLRASLAQAFPRQPEHRNISRDRDDAG